MGEKKSAVTAMFDRIAPRYDLANAVLTAGADAKWRRLSVSLLAPRVGDRVLDVGCGTGRLAEAVLWQQPTARVVAVDPARAMARRCRRDVRGADVAMADGERLPFRDASFDGAVNGFVLRNLEDLPGFFAEMRRVLRPGGRLVSLEIAKPRGALYGPIHGLYFGRLVPLLGGLVGGDAAAYRYLAGSLADFPSPEALCGRMEQAGFEAESVPLQRGAVVAYVARAV
ncbi:MAG TPA: ubiquinone/menaquinone biosynthesis methyltransferase [Candidatus Thermoplasmatota archaeon]|nr:ubiquinone/menaquinone biosynthesis methyltransferase [Candidatus Thermoplasmatota archaeon]